MEFGIEELLLVIGEPLLVFTSAYNLILKIRFLSVITEIQSCCVKKDIVQKCLNTKNRIMANILFYSKIVLKGLEEQQKGLQEQQQKLSFVSPHSQYCLVPNGFLYFSYFS